MTAPSQTSSVPTPSDDNQPEQIPPDRILFAEIRQRGFLRLDNPLVSPLRKALAEAGCKIKTAMLADACSTPEVLAVLARGEASGEDTLTVDADDTGIADDLDRTTLVDALGTALSNAGRNVDPPILATAIAKVLVDRDGPKQNPDKTRHDRKGGSFSAGEVRRDRAVLSQKVLLDLAGRGFRQF